MPANFFIVNPDVLGANAVLATDSGWSTYNALQIELRRRFRRLAGPGQLHMEPRAYEHLHSAAGALTSSRTHCATPGWTGGRRRSTSAMRFKANWIYELPIGPGRRFDLPGGNGVIGKILEGWETDGIIRWQSGRIFSLTGGRATVNQFDSGVVLVGMRSQSCKTR